MNGLKESGAPSAPLVYRHVNQRNLANDLKAKMAPDAERIKTHAEKVFAKYPDEKEVYYTTLLTKKGSVLASSLPAGSEPPIHGKALLTITARRIRKRSVRAHDTKAHVRLRGSGRTKLSPDDIFDL